ncbi:hypothetical protein CANARDRAFT_26189 [[Candida] arabinofermentans NRRL YB-2248]|uniref:Cargo-transport protein YPP1 n=1 Tax=[Candida] arabinofermentans NRRL YB-2248 TaxID=983967 RepID=A0A1E4T8D8_9ASCO|nr:hypothetical protein CANARDRAFT_26189 [[Candida] arabinofermentans NRRL YB-2248]
MVSSIEDLDLRLQTQLICGAQPLETSVIPKTNGFVKTEEEEEKEEEEHVNGDLSTKSSSPLVLLEQLAHSNITSAEQLNSELSRLQLPVGQYENYISYLKAVHDPVTNIPTLLEFQKVNNEFDLMIFMKSFALSISTPYFPSFFKYWLSLKQFPLKTNLVGSYYFDEVVTEVAAEHFSSVTTLSEFNTSFLKFSGVSKLNNFGIIISFIIAFKVFGQNSGAREEATNALQHHLKNLTSTLKFPKAEETNDEIKIAVEGVIYIMENYQIKLNLNAFIDDALSKSYQSIPVMKLWCLSAMIDHDSKKVMSTFRVYLEYVRSEKVLHNNQYRDIVDVIDLCGNVLTHLMSGKVTRSLFDEVQEWFNFFSNLVEVDFFPIFVDSNLGPIFLQKLGTFWYNLGLVSKSSCQHHTITTDILKERLLRTNDYFAKSVSTIAPNQSAPDVTANQYFEYAISLVKLGNYKDAIKPAKTALKYSPDNIKLLNFITLIFSAYDENPTRSLTMASDIVGNPDYLSKIQSSVLSSSEKWDIVQFQMTYIALIEAENDQFAALEYLSSIFGIIHVLFGITPNSIKLTQPQDNDEAQTIISDSRWSHRPSIVNPDNYGNDLPTNGASHKHNVSSVVHTKSSRSKLVAHSQKPAVTLSETEKKMMQEIWLWTSKLFQRCGMISDAEGCIEEAEAIGGSCSKTHSRLGQLYIGVNSQLALQELEISLDIREDGNAEAIIGLACLILGVNKNVNPDAGPQSAESDTSTLFINDKDKSSAIARCKNYLESLTCTYDNCQTSEVYYCLSHVYEYIDNSEMLEQALIKSVELEDFRPVRSIEDILKHP